MSEFENRVLTKEFILPYNTAITEFSYAEIENITKTENSVQKVNDWRKDPTTSAILTRPVPIKTTSRTNIDRNVDDWTFYRTNIARNCKTDPNMKETRKKLYILNDGVLPKYNKTRKNLTKTIRMEGIEYENSRDFSSSYKYNGSNHDVNAVNGRGRQRSVTISMGEYWSFVGGNCGHERDFSKTVVLLLLS